MERNAFENPHDAPDGDEGRDRFGGEAPTVADVMEAVDEVVHMDMDMTEARLRLRASGVPFLPVVDGIEIVGTVSARELDDGDAEARAKDRTELVRNHLSKKVAFCFADDEPRVARAMMNRSGQGLLLVVDRDRQFLGVVRRKALDHALSGGVSAATETEADDRTAVTPARAQGARPGHPPSHGPRARLKE